MSSKPLTAHRSIDQRGITLGRAGHLGYARLLGTWSSADGSCGSWARSGRLDHSRAAASPQISGTSRHGGGSPQDTGRSGCSCSSACSGAAAHPRGPIGSGSTKRPLRAAPVGRPVLAVGPRPPSAPAPVRKPGAICLLPSGIGRNRLGRLLPASRRRGKLLDEADRMLEGRGCWPRAVAA